MLPQLPLNSALLRASPLQNWRPNVPLLSSPPSSRFPFSPPLTPGVSPGLPGSPSGSDTQFPPEFEENFQSSVTITPPGQYGPLLLHTMSMMSNQVNLGLQRISKQVK